MKDEIDTNVPMGVGAGTKKPGPTDEEIVADGEQRYAGLMPEMATPTLTDQARKIHGLFNEISNILESFLENGGQFNLRVYHDGGCESIDLHVLNGEFECSFLQVKELKLRVPGEFDDEGNKLA